MDAIRIAARRNRPRPHREDRGLVSRPSRHGDVLRRARLGCASGGRDQPVVDADVARHHRSGSRATRTWCRSTTSRVLEQHARRARRRRSPVLIIEPVMMNIGIAEPEPGYLQGLQGPAAPHGCVLIFDEVKWGATIAAGGATERYGVRPTSPASRRRSSAGRRARRSVAWRHHGHHRPRRRAAGHVQRQPARGGGRAARAHRGPHPRRLRAPRRARARLATRLSRRDRRSTASPRTRSTSAPRAASRTGPSRCATTATSSRPTTRSSTRRTRGWSTAACS